MQCDVCQRTASSKLPFNCTTCARDILYQPRLKSAQLLLEKESIEKQVEQAVHGNTKNSKASLLSNQDNKGISPAWIVRRATAEQTLAETQTETIQSHIEILRQETQAMKVDIIARRKVLQQKKSELASAKEELSHFQETAPEPLRKSIRRTTHRWDILHSKMAEGRLFLCREAADLYTLQHHKRKKGAKERDVYTIGGVPIADLRDLNTASPTDLTVSLSHIAHLLHLTSSYLSLKLPAELTLPHRDYPRPTIFSPTSSYTTSRPLPYPGTTPTHSPSASRHTATTTKTPHYHSNSKPLSTSSSAPTDRHPTPQRPPPRARILHLPSPLPTLFTQDQHAYDSFVEAITFLAWDIAWLCRTQGHPVAEKNWDDICAVGRNLYLLLLSPSPAAASAPILPPSPPMSPSKKYAIPATPASHATQVEKVREKAGAVPAPGTYSHTSPYAYLGTAQGTQYMRGWRLASAVKAVERVKGMLLAERTGAEWEILDGGEDAVGEEEEGGGWEGRGAEVRSLDGGVEEEDGGEDGGGGRGEGRSGWMKVKRRGDAGAGGE